MAILCLRNTLKCMKSKVSSKGQVTVPAQIRSKLGLQPGTIVQFEIHENAALMRKAGPGGHPVDRLFGMLKPCRPTDVLLDEMRGRRPRQP